MFWLDATNKSTIEQSYKTIATQICKRADRQYSVDEARQELENYQSHWLLLFDGADDMDEISDLFPPGTYGDVIYTSRNHMLRRLLVSQILQVSKMADEEAQELLLKSARLDTSAPEHKQHASVIVTKLGCLALAVDQAGAYIANGTCYLEEYLGEFEKRRRDLMKNNAYRKASGIDQAVYATWDLSYSAISKKTGPSHDLDVQGANAALEILQILPFFHNEGVIEETFKLAAENWESDGSTDSEAEERVTNNANDGLLMLSLHPDGIWNNQNFRRGVQTLLSFSLIDRPDPQRRLHMHPLVHLWAFDRMTEDEKKRSGKEAGRILAQSISYETRSEDYAYRRDLLPHITTFQRQTIPSSLPKNANRFQNFAQVFYEAGWWKEAEKLRVQAVDIDRLVHGPEHPETLTAMSDLALTYRQQGQWKKAEEINLQVLEISKDVLGQQHPNTLTTMNNLASTYWEQGHWKEAEELNLQVLEIRKDVLGPQNPDTLRSMSNLASTYWQQGRWKEAENLDLQVLELRKDKLGPQHPDTLSSMNNLASTYWEQRRWKEAEEFDSQVLEIRKDVLGPQHPDTLNSMQALASTYSHQGHVNEAENLELELLKTKKRVLGSEHPDTLMSMSNLAHTLYSRSRSSEAIKLMRECCELRRRVIGPTHPDTRASLKSLGAWEQEADETNDLDEESSSWCSTSESET